LDQVAKLPLVLPGNASNQRRSVIDRAFADAGLTPNIVAETDAVLSELSAVRTGVGGSIFNAGTFSSVYRGDLAAPLLIEPPLSMTCSVISSSDSPLTHAAEAIKTIIIQFVADHIGAKKRPGAELVD